MAGVIIDPQPKGTFRRYMTLAGYHNSRISPYIHTMLDISQDHQYKSRYCTHTRHLTPQAYSIYTATLAGAQGSQSGP